MRKCHSPRTRMKTRTTAANGTNHFTEGRLQLRSAKLQAAFSFLFGPGGRFLLNRRECELELGRQSVPVRRTGKGPERTWPNGAAGDCSGGRRNANHDSPQGD